MNDHVDRFACAALPSPGIPGTFVFPPSTPTSLIAPISLPGEKYDIV